MNKAAVLILVGICGACQTYHPQATSLVPAVTVQEVPYVARTVRPDCKPAPGVTLEVQRISSTAVMLSANGLQPRELPSVFFNTGITGTGSKQVEVQAFANGAEQNGYFSMEVTDIYPLPGHSSATWDVRLVHRSGVACAQVTLP